MLTLTKKTEYALLALMELASDKGWHSVHALAEQTSLSRSLLGKILQELHQGGLVSSQQGARGGYALQQEPELIALLDIVKLIEGKPALTTCQRGQSCDQEKSCGLKNPMQNLTQHVHQIFQDMTLKDLIEQP